MHKLRWNRSRILEIDEGWNMSKLREFVSFLKQIERDDWLFYVQLATFLAAFHLAHQESRKFNQDIQRLKDYIHEQNTQNGCGVENVR